MAHGGALDGIGTSCMFQFRIVYCNGAFSYLHVQIASVHDMVRAGQRC